MDQQILSDHAVSKLKITPWPAMITHFLNVELLQRI